MTTAPPQTAINPAKLQTIAAVGFWSGMLGFLTWFAMGVDSILRPVQDVRRDAFWLVPFVFTMVTFCCAHVLQRRRSRWEIYGFITVLIASAMVCAGNIGLQLDITPLLWLGFPGGPIVWTIGMVAFGIGTIRARVLPVYAGWALIIFEPGSVLTAVAFSPIAPLLPRGAYSGNIEKGIALAVIAWGVRKARLTAPADFE